MAVDFRNVVDWVIPEGNVVKVTDSLNRVIWRKYQYTFVDYVTCETNPTGIIVPINIPSNSSWDIMIDYAYTGSAPGTNDQIPNSTSVSFMGGEASNTDKAGFFQYRINSYSQAYAQTDVWWNLTGSVGTESSSSSSKRQLLSDIGDRHVFKWTGTSSAASCSRTDAYSNEVITTPVSNIYLVKQNWSGYWGFGLLATYQGVPQSSSYGQFVGNIYGCYIKINGEDVYNFVPAMRNKDSVYGLYDTVNNQFYPSVTSHPFTHATVPVTSVLLTNTNVPIGQSKDIPYKIKPGAASNRNLSWTISDSTKVTIDPNTGTVTGQSYGSTTATATTLDGTNISGTCTVLSYVPTTGISLSPASVEVAVDGTSIITPIITPSNATFKTVKWTKNGVTSAGDITLPSQTDGVVEITGVRKSNYGNKITVTGTAYDGQTATCKVQVYEGTIDVEDVTINQSSVTLAVGQSTNLIATVSPADASNQVVTWKSSNSSIASVNASGVVTANAVGTCTITVTTADGGYTDTCTINVVNEVHSLTIVPTPSNATVKFNGTVAGTGTRSINVAPGLMVSYEVSLTGYTPVSGSYTMGNTDHSISVTLDRILKPVTGITVSPSSAMLRAHGYQGDSIQLSADVTPSDAGNTSVTWSSSNTNVATVSSTGLVTAGSNTGNAVITAKANDGSNCSGSCSVKVVHIVLSQTSANLIVGQTLQLSANISPSGIAYGWKSSDTSKATVSSTGKVTAIAPATGNNRVYVYCTVNGGDYTANPCEITIIPSITPPTPSSKSVRIYNSTSYTIQYGDDSSTGSSIGSGDSAVVTISEESDLYISRTGGSTDIVIDECSSAYTIHANTYLFDYDDIVDGDEIVLAESLS